MTKYFARINGVIEEVKDCKTMCFYAYMYQMKKYFITYGI